jgi:hypothetical protein
MRDENDLNEMKDSLENRPRCPRRRFDFVIANPPYVGYNESSKQGVLIFKLIKPGKDKKADLNNIYGVNLHSIPARSKKYAPKPNLYAFFIAIGLALLKDNAKLCYIIPQTILTAGDLDVLRYHLAKFTTIEKIITFSGKMFIGRGLKQNRPVATSSLILVVRRAQSDGLNYVEIINCKETSTEIETTLQNISSGRGIRKKKIMQGKLLESVSNWNFIKHEKAFLDFCETYKKTTESIAAYYDHRLAKHQFKSGFYFDKGLVFPKEAVRKGKEVHGQGYFNLISLPGNCYCAEVINEAVAKKDIRVPHGSQGIGLFEKKYKIVWSYMNYTGFYFSDENIMINFNFVIITSDNREEILYLLSLLNSTTIRRVLEGMLRSETEKDLLIGIKTVKEFVRVPKITENNQFIKGEIIKRTGELLALEEIKLSDLVDFSGVMMQKFDRVLVKGNHLVLCKDKKESGLKIICDKNLVEKTIAEKYRSSELEFERDRITLSELKTLPAIDFEKQATLKDYIDDLVFALYFNIRLTKVGLDCAAEIKEKCRKDRFYQMLNVSE